MDNTLKKSLLAGTALASMLTSPASHALDLSYLSPDYVGLFLFSDATYEQISYRDWEFSTIIGRFGYTLNRFVELEFRAGSGTETATGLQNIEGTVQNAEFNLDYIAGGYLVGSLPVSHRGRAYALLGYTYAGITTDIPPGDGVESDFSFGLGGDVSIGKKFSMNAEFSSYLFHQDLELHALSFGIKIDF